VLSCSRHGVVAARLTSERPGSVITLSKTLTVLGEHCGHFGTDGTSLLMRPCSSQVQQTAGNLVTITAAFWLQYLACSEVILAQTYRPEDEALICSQGKFSNGDAHSGSIASLSEETCKLSLAGWFKKHSHVCKARSNRQHSARHGRLSAEPYGASRMTSSSV
jgi:hypothetical protein